MSNSSILLYDNCWHKFGIKTCSKTLKAQTCTKETISFYFNKGFYNNYYNSINEYSKSTVFCLK